MLKWHTRPKNDPTYQTMHSPRSKTQTLGKVPQSTKNMPNYQLRAHVYFPITFLSTIKCSRPQIQHQIEMQHSLTRFKYENIRANSARYTTGLTIRPDYELSSDKVLRQIDSLILGGSEIQGRGRRAMHRNTYIRG